jgi:hypothetical protein
MNSRRDFAKKVALLATSSLTPPLSAVQAQGTAKPDSQTTAETLTQIARQRYGKFLNAEQLKAVQRSIERSQRSAEYLKEIKLKNSDEPAFLFSAEVP